jgi:hypothetical protein
LDFIKTYILFQNKDDRGDKMKALQMVMNVTIVVMVLSLYPLVKKGLVKAA